MSENITLFFKEAEGFIAKFAIDQLVSKKEALDLVSKECRKEWGTPCEETESLM